MKITSLLCVLFLGFTVSWSQNESVIPYFRGSEFSGKVFLEWEVMQGNTCNGIDVLRSTDSVNFEKIGDIEGICGSTQASIRYTFTDTAPIVNEINYYRLSLGGIGFSWVIEVEVRFFGKGKYSLFPNPVVATSELHFDNDLGQSVVLSIVDATGVVVYSSTGTGEFFEVPADCISNGNYMFRISVKDSDEVIASGSLLVQ